MKRPCFPDFQDIGNIEPDRESSSSVHQVNQNSNRLKCVGRGTAETHDQCWSGFRQTTRLLYRVNCSRILNQRKGSKSNYCARRKLSCDARPINPHLFFWSWKTASPRHDRQTPNPAQNMAEQTAKNGRTGHWALERCSWRLWLKPRAARRSWLLRLLTLLRLGLAMAGVTRDLNGSSRVVPEPRRH